MNTYIDLSMFTYVGTLGVSMESVEAVFRARARELIELYEATKELPEPKVKGILREEFVRRFLAEFLPDRFGVGRSGVIMAADGSSTGELDVIVYDKENLTLFKPLGLWLGEYVYPSEAVYLAIQVERSLSSQRLIECLENLLKAKRLPRRACYLEEGAVYTTYRLYGRDWRVPPLLAIVFSYKGMDLNSLSNELRKYVSKRGLKPWEYPDLIAVLEKGYIAWGEEENRIALTPDKESKPLPIRAKPYQVLAFAYTRIVQLLGQLKLPPINVLEYMGQLVFGERLRSQDPDRL